MTLCSLFIVLKAKVGQSHVSVCMGSYTSLEEAIIDAQQWWLDDLLKPILMYVVDINGRCIHMETKRNQGESE